MLGDHEHVAEAEYQPHDRKHPVRPHPGPESGSHLLIAMDVDQVPEADVRHIDEGVVYAVQVGPAVLNEAEEGRGKQDEHDDAWHRGDECVQEDLLASTRCFAHNLLCLDDND